MRSWLSLSCCAVLSVACGSAPSSHEHEAASSDDALRAALPEDAEIKVVLADVTFDPATLGASAEDRDVTFYDTPTLDGWKRGMLLRSRRARGGDDDVTVKLRPMMPAQIEKAFKDDDGFKCELDASIGSPGSSSCSFSEEADGSRVAAAWSAKEIEALWSDKSIRFVRQVAPGFDARRLRPFGPIASTVWKLDDADLGTEVTFERWVVPHGATTLEASIKIKTAHRQTMEAALVRWLADHGLAPSPVQSTKTAAALQALSKAAPN